MPILGALSWKLLRHLKAKNSSHNLRLAVSATIPWSKQTERVDSGGCLDPGISMWQTACMKNMGATQHCRSMMTQPNIGLR